jgi:hypothetical protein
MQPKSPDPGRVKAHGVDPAVRRKPGFLVTPRNNALRRDDLSRSASEKMKSYAQANAEPFFCNALV